MHSGLQLGGNPFMSGKHAHLHSSPCRCGNCEFGPQGFGSHGSSSTTGSMAKLKVLYMQIFYKNSKMHILNDNFIVLKNLQLTYRPKSTV